MPRFNVGFYYDESGTVVVEAPSQKKAEALVYKHLEQHGANFEFDACGREYDTTGADEITYEGVSAVLPVTLFSIPQSLIDEVVDYLQNGAAGDEYSDRLTNIIKSGAVDSLEIIEFKGTDGMLAFFHQMEDDISEFLKGRDKHFSSVKETIDDIFKEVAVMEQIRLHKEEDELAS